MSVVGLRCAPDLQIAPVLSRAFLSVFLSSFKDAELMQQRKPLGYGPSGNT
jgi:hypothetical protein